MFNIKKTQDYANYQNGFVELKGTWELSLELVHTV